MENTPLTTTEAEHDLEAYVTRLLVKAKFIPIVPIAADELTVQYSQPLSTIPPFSTL